MKKYCIIGGAGFIGSHLSAELKNQGNKVVGIDKDVDILSPLALEILRQEKPDVVYYLAGPMELRKGAGAAELQSWQEKYAGLKSVFEALAKMRTRVVLVSSGGALYSNPDSPYAKANIFLEALLKKSGANHVILRFSNVYGPAQWKEGVVPSVILNRLHGQPVMIGGDGSQTRDFLYIFDAVSALMQAGEAGRSIVPGTFDVGSGTETSVNEVVVEVEKILSKKAKREYQGSAGPQKSVVHPEKFRQTFGWSPKVILKEGLEKTIAYYKSNSA